MWFLVLLKHRSVWETWVLLSWGYVSLLQDHILEADVALDLADLLMAAYFQEAQAEAMLLASQKNCYAMVVAVRTLGHLVTGYHRMQALMVFWVLRCLEIPVEVEELC